MATITEHEERQVKRANASGRQPVVFIHGLWLLPSSWDRWAALFRKAGYTTLTPGWPDDPETVEDAKAREAQAAHDLASQGHLLRLWTLPDGRALGLYQARDAAQMQAILEALPLAPWMTMGTTPLSPHPSDPAIMYPPAVPPTGTP